MSRVIDVWKTWEGRVVDGKFPLRQWLGSSEHSAVFLTERAGGEPQKAAVKLIPAETFSAHNIEETAQLARWTDSAKLSHPHLIRLYECGRVQIDGGNFLYVVMEYAEENLAQILPQRPLSPAEVKEMLPPTAETLAFLHQAGFAHGHIKPSNIMAVDNQLKISADSLRKTGERDKQEPSAYLAPEVANTGPSAAADIWSLGVMLVAVLTQHEPALKNRSAVPAFRSEAALHDEQTSRQARSSRAATRKTNRETSPIKARPNLAHPASRCLGNSIGSRTRPEISPSASPACGNASNRIPTCSRRRPRRSIACAVS